MSIGEAVPFMLSVCSALLAMTGYLLAGALAFTHINRQPGDAFSRWYVGGQGRLRKVLIWGAWPIAYGYFLLKREAGASAP